MERDRIKAREDKLNMFKNTDEEEREKLLEDQWQQKIERTFQSKVQIYSSSFEMDPKVPQEQADL